MQHSSVDAEPAEPVEHVRQGERLLALIVFGRYRGSGIHFFTAPEFSQQLAYMAHPRGKLIEPHLHNPVPRVLHYTQEVLFIRKGLLRIDFYDTAQKYLKSRMLGAGDVVLLIEGGHGFEVIEEVEMFEVKQGPYVGEQEKTRFTGIDASEIRLDD